MSKLRIHAFNTEGPTHEIEADSWASVGGHLGHLTGDFETVIVFKVDDAGVQTLVMRYDVDGFDL